MATKSRAVDEWQAESDLRTLMEAQKIRADKKRFEVVQKLARERLAAVAAVASSQNGEK